MFQEEELSIEADSAWREQSEGKKVTALEVFSKRGL
jgi:hypothetical protein